MMKKLAWLLGLAVFMALPAVAQEAPRVEIFAGYSLLRSGVTVPVGFQFSVAGNFNEAFGIVGDFGAHYKTIFGLKTRTYEYLFGPRLNMRGDTASGFFHFLAGASTFSVSGVGSATQFALGFGNGLDVNVGGSIAIRVLQFDYIQVRVSGGWATEYRLGAGVVFKAGEVF